MIQRALHGSPAIGHGANAKNRGVNPSLWGQNTWEAEIDELRRSRH